MAYELRENSGSLFKNKNKKKDTHPNATGDAMIGGVVYRISAWTKKDKNGDPWQSLSFEQKDDSKLDPKQEKRAVKQDTFDDDDKVPF